MFESSKIIARFHHLYLMQALLEIQRHCNKLYSKLKHRFVILLSIRLHQLSKLKQFNRLPFGLRSNYDCRKSCYRRQQQERSMANFSQDLNQGSASKNLINDLNQLFINQTNNQSRSAVSIPMQMMLLPFITVPNQPNICSSTSNVQNGEHSANHLPQQWFDVSINKNSSDYITMMSNCQLFPSANDSSAIQLIPKQQRRHQYQQSWSISSSKEAAYNSTQQIKSYGDSQYHRKPAARDSLINYY